MQDLQNHKLWLLDVQCIVWHVSQQIMALSPNLTQWPSWKTYRKSHPVTQISFRRLVSTTFQLPCVIAQFWHNHQIPIKSLIYNFSIRQLAQPSCCSATTRQLSQVIEVKMYQLISYHIMELQYVACLPFTCLRIRSCFIHSSFPVK